MLWLKFWHSLFCFQHGYGSLQNQDGKLVVRKSNDSYLLSQETWPLSGKTQENIGDKVSGAKQTLFLSLKAKILGGK